MKKESVKNFYKIWRKHGINLIVKMALDHIGIKNYITVRYPKTEIEVTVRTRPFWKNLEEGDYEQHVLPFVLNSVKEGQTILDVGSWIGSYTLLFSKLVGPNGRVIAFEPSPSSFNILLDNLERNNTSNVTAENICLGNSVGKVNLRGSGMDASTVRLDKLETSQIVPCTTLDKYCKDNNIVPDGIKIDVEGAEDLVIGGGRNIIKTHSPWVILEFHGDFFNEKERNECWKKITRSANEIIYINKDSKYCGRCLVFIKY